MKEVRITDESGTVLYTASFVFMLPGQASRVVATHLRALNSVGSLAEELDATSSDMESDEYIDGLASLQERTWGAKALLLSAVCGWPLPPGDVAWERGNALAEQKTAEGWSPDALDALYRLALVHAKANGLRNSVASKATITADFSAPLTD